MTIPFARYSEGRCNKCNKAFTNHKSGKCIKCRSSVCKECKIQFNNPKNREWCGNCSAKMKARKWET